MVRTLKKYASLIIMHNGHKSWSVGCVSLDRSQTEWVEGLDWPELAELIGMELRSAVEVVPARLIHGGDIMDNHTRLGDPGPLTKEQKKYVREAVQEVIDRLHVEKDSLSQEIAGILGVAAIKLSCMPTSD